MNVVSEKSGMLYLVGLGLGDARDITVRGLAVVKSAHKVFLEGYTSLLVVDKSELVRVRSPR